MNDTEKIDTNGVELCADDSRYDSLDYLFRLAVEMRTLGLPWTTTTKETTPDLTK